MRPLASTPEQAAVSLVQPDETLDMLYRGAVSVIQSKTGYRFSLEAVILAHSLRAETGRWLELGAGCAIVPLLLARFGAMAEIWGVEVQPQLADRARRSVQLNNAGQRVRIIEGDLRNPPPELAGALFDGIMGNPPYRELSSGKVSPHEERARARHELDCTLEQMLHAAARFLRHKGKLRLIYDVSRLAGLLGLMHQLRLEPKEIRFIHDACGHEAVMVLVTGVLGGHPGLSVLAPLTIHDPDGSFSPEMKEILGEKR